MSSWIPSNPRPMIGYPLSDGTLPQGQAPVRPGCGLRPSAPNSWAETGGGDAVQVKGVGKRGDARTAGGDPAFEIFDGGGAENEAEPDGLGASGALAGCGMHHDDVAFGAGAEAVGDADRDTAAGLVPDLPQVVQLGIVVGRRVLLGGATAAASADDDPAAFRGIDHLRQVTEKRKRPLPGGGAVVHQKLGADAA